MEVVHIYKYIDYLFYDLRVGNHQAKSVKQFSKIGRDVGRLHANGYVHGDIRLANIVFGDGVDEAWLIDFDYAGKLSDNAVYPYGWQRNTERHPDAREGASFSNAFTCYGYNHLYQKSPQLYGCSCTSMQCEKNIPGWGSSKYCRCQESV
jgi:hypothetical protein